MFLDIETRRGNLEVEVVLLSPRVLSCDEAVTADTVEVGVVELR